jgi:NAD-dependent deacetylase
MPRVGTALELAAIVRDRGPAVVLTGAGMSTESGIPDFRSASGIWADVDPFEVASIDAFRRDPLRVWRWYGPRIGGLLEAQPNAGHVALAALERGGHVQAVLTQNIDLLHTRAGSEEVVELHGSIREFRCLACGGV